MVVVVGGGGAERNTPRPHTPKILLFAALIHATIFLFLSAPLLGPARFEAWGSFRRLAVLLIVG